MDIAAIENEYHLHVHTYEHDWIHIIYIIISTIFFLMEVCQRISIHSHYASKDLQVGSYLPSINRYPTDLTPSFLNISLLWYLLYLWQSFWMIYSINGIFRRTPSSYFYQHPCAMNKWCFFYSSFGLIFYMPQLIAAAANKYGVGISIFRHLGTFFEIIIIVIVVHVSLWENLKEYQRNRYFIDIWLTRLLYQNGLALWAMILFYETTLSIMIGLIYSETTSSATSCLIGCAILFVGLIVLFLLENFLFFNSLAFTFSPWFGFLWIFGGIISKERDISSSSTVIVYWLIRFLFCLTCLLIIIRLFLFFWRYKNKLVPTFQPTKVYSLIREPRSF